MFRQLPRPRHRADQRPRRQHALRRPRPQHLPARLDAREPLPVTVGAALAFKRRGEPRVALTFFGDGALSTGDVHEGINLAGVLARAGRVRDPEQPVRVLHAHGPAMRNTNIAERIEGGWCIPCAQVDGTDALAVYETVRARRRAGARRRRAAGGRGADAAHGRPRRPRRRAATSTGAEADEFAHARDPVERLAARLLLDGLSARGGRRPARGRGGRGGGGPRRGRAGAAARPGDARPTASTPRRCDRLRARRRGRRAARPRRGPSSRETVIPRERDDDGADAHGLDDGLRARAAGRRARAPGCSTPQAPVPSSAGTGSTIAARR